MPNWLRTWLAIAAVIAAAAMLWVGLTIFAVLAALVLLPLLVWAWLTGRLRTQTRSVTIEGSAVVVRETGDPADPAARLK